MRFLSTFIMTLVIGTCLGQPDTLDTVRTGDVVILYKRGKIQERWYYVNDLIDIKVIYIYRDGVLVRREWWRVDKIISFTIEN